MQNLLDPAILFFVFGLLVGTVRSNLEIPPQIARFLSLYLLMAPGLKGGFALAKSGLTAEVMVSLACAVLLALAVPALMESPAIVMAVVLANQARQRQARAPGAPSHGHSHGMRKLLHESLTDGAQLLLLGAMVVGLITGESGQKAMQPFAGDLFKGMLAFFLLDMGLIAARNFGALKGRSPCLLAYALGAPLVHAGLALALAALAGLSAGNGALLVVLAASASYIAVPAVLRVAIPEASPSLYFGMSLGLTLPFNILLGIPLYVAAAYRFL
jgi:hypothetical protein